jgi:diguanylate cyclase (GGDEF)-like protein/PAS domain S-box-containing protein
MVIPTLVTGVASATDAMFKSVFHHSPEAIALTRAQDGIILEVNQEWQKLLGYSREDVVGRTEFEVGMWVDEASQELVCSALKSQGRLNDAEVTLLMRDGVPRLVRMNATLLECGSDLCVLAYLRDITAERLSQEALKAGELVLERANRAVQDQLNFIQKITSRAPGVLYELKIWPDGRRSFPFISAAVEQMIGVTAELVQHDASTFFARILSQDWPAMEKATVDSRRDLSLWQCEFRCKAGQGAIRWLLGSAMPQMQEDGSVLWCGSIVDITAQKATMAKLQESEARFRGLTALSSDWYWEQDEHFRFVRVDGNLESSHAAPAETYLGKTRWESGVQGVSAAQWAEHRATLEAHQVFHDFEVQRLRTDGSLMWASISGTPIIDANGKFCGYRGTGSDITARKRAEADIERLAFFDALTGLPNRRLLMDRLEKAIVSSARRSTHGALLFIDLDNFKVLNDTLGHHMGDELLKQVAERLSECVRAIDTVARLGGDEFVVMLEDLHASAPDAGAQVEAVGRKVLASLNRQFVLAGQPHHSSPSIGVTLFFQSENTVDELLKRADLAMYQAKAAGRNTLRFFDPVMQAAASARARLESDLRLALTQNEFALFYQPVVDDRSRVIGVEALLRWRHAERGMVSPAEFIPVAEQTGLILPLGQWVLEVACAQLVTWSAQPATQRLTMAVNVSARQFRHPEFSNQLLALLRQSGANPYRLKLEITESLLLSDIDDAVAKMGELRSIGVNFALDDFGTGYSSLSYLKRLPLDQLKIDQSFVRDVLKDPNDATIARTILNLAQSLDLSVVAEGVETAGQHDFLLQAGCKAFQGYLFGRPVPVEQLVLPTN